MPQLELGSSASLAFFTTSAAEERRIEAEELTQATKRRRKQRPRRIALAIVAMLSGLVLLPLTDAGADPFANDWLRLRTCESGNRYTLNTGNGHYGAYQFDLATWKSVGGSGYPNQASAAQQDARALILYRERGWQPWQCAKILGLTNDSDAKSGRTSDISTDSYRSTTISTTSGVPAWPGSRTYQVGDKNSVIAAWQRQMNKRGANFDGSGQFGVKTATAAKRLQKLNGLPVTGLIGPLTWALAWNGKY